MLIQVCTSALIGSAPVSRFALTRYSRAEKKHETRDFKDGALIGGTVDNWLRLGKLRKGRGGSIR